MKAIAAAALAVFALALSGCGKSAETAASAEAPAGGGRLYGNAQRGQGYVERWCTTCHTLGATGTDGAPALALLKKDPKKTDAYVRGFLLAPHKPMPPLPFTNQEIEDIIAYLREP